MTKQSRNILWIVLLTFMCAFTSSDEVSAKVLRASDDNYAESSYGEILNYKNYIYSIHKDGSVGILGYMGSEKVLNIPSEIDGIPVRRIESLGRNLGPDQLFIHTFNKKVKEIIVPDGVISIEGFNKCMNVEKVVLPDSITQIGKETFDGCKKLKSVNIPKELKIMEEGAFSGCIVLPSVHLPDGLEKIGAAAFYECQSLKQISIPDTVTAIGTEAFSLCSNLKKVKLSKNLTVIDESVFASCYKLKEVQIPIKVKEIREKAFAGTALTQVTIPKNVTSIEKQAFAYNKKLKKVIIKSKKIQYFGYKSFITWENPNVIIDVPNKCIKKYKRMLKNAKSFKGSMKIK